MDALQPIAVYTLLVDIIGSTKRILKESTEIRDKFNLALVRMLPPYMVLHSLDDAIVKFTGDGWIVSIDGPSKLLNLCALAYHVRMKFNSDILEHSGLTFSPPFQLRLGLGFGSDLPVEIMGRRDFVGDSIRRAQRISTLCLPDEILFDPSVKAVINRDFNCTMITPNDRLEQLGIKKWEDDIDFIYSLGAPKQDVLTVSRMSLCLVDAMCPETEREAIYANIIAKTKQPTLSEKDRETLDQANLLLSSREKTDLSDIIEARLEKDGFKRSIYSWTKLLNLVKTFEQGREVVDEMIGKGIEPNIVTYSTLLNKAVTFEQGRKVVDEMIGKGIEPNIVTYNTLFKKDFEDVDLQNTLNWYFSLTNHPNSALEPLILNLIKKQNLSDAYSLILRYPNLPASKKILTKNIVSALEQFEKLKETPSYEPNFDYAMGIAYYENSQYDNATEHLEKAAGLLSTHEKRKAHIDSMLKNIAGIGSK